VKKTEIVSIETEVYYSDFSNRKIKDYDRHFNQCVRCGKHFTDDECGDTQDDGSLCKKCVDEGYEFDYDEGVGIIDKNGKTVEAPWL